MFSAAAFKMQDILSLLKKDDSNKQASKTKHVFHHLIKKYLRGKLGGSRFESEPKLGWDRVPRLVPGAVQVLPVLRDTTEVFHIARRI